MAAPLVEEYLRKVWIGHEYVLETSKDGRFVVSALNPSIGFVNLCNLGLVSGF